jgi:hypothetical protein
MEGMELTCGRRVSAAGEREGGSGGRESGPAQWTGLDYRRDSNQKLIFEFQLNLDFGMSWRNSTRRFRRNFDMRIFPKFF